MQDNDTAQETSANTTFFGRWQAGVVLIVVGLFLLGGLIRLIDLADPPLDFHPTRQLRNALVARGIYYRLAAEADPARREAAAAFQRAVGQYEPPILESLVAVGYRIAGQEIPWLARVINTLFWLVGGLAVFDMARRMSSVDGGVVALGYYLLLPFAAQASRSFQPDPGMVMWFSLAVYFLYRWSGDQRWRWVVLAGLTAGMAALVKVVIAYIIAGGAIGTVLASLGFKRAFRSPQVWSLAGLMVLPSLIYYVLFTPSGRITEFVNAWTLALIRLIASPEFYVRWMGMLHSLFGLAVLFVGLAGVIIAPRRARALLAGLWAGYLVYGLTLPYQMTTHNYYHLQVTPILALSLAPAAALVLAQAARQPRPWRIVLLGALLVGAAYPAWVARSTLFAEDYRNEPAYWTALVEQLPAEGRMVALTQDYGYRLMYFGWRNVDLWPITGEQELAELRGRDSTFDELFQRHAGEQDYFLITAFGQYNRQPELRAMLEEHFTLVVEGDGYLVYDLNQPVEPSP
jgi:hypothetical protein